MEFDKDKVDEMTLTLLYLVMWDDKIGSAAWKGFDWETMDRLHEKQNQWVSPRKAERRQKNFSRSTSH